MRSRGREPSQNQLQEMTKFAQYVSTINLSKVDKWEYPLKTFPRPKGKAARVIITEYDLPRPEAMPHDASTMRGATSGIPIRFAISR